MRISPEQKAWFQQAASLAGCTLSDFVIRSVRSAAGETIRKYQVMTLSAPDSTAFVDALLNPPEPHEHLRAAVRCYRAFTNE